MGSVFKRFRFGRGAVIAVFFNSAIFAGTFCKAAPALPETSPKTQEPEKQVLPRETLEFLSMGEYWGVRTDIDAAQGGSGERKIIDEQYDWDSSPSALKEAESFEAAQRQEEILRQAEKES